MRARLSDPVTGRCHSTRLSCATFVAALLLLASARAVEAGAVRLALFTTGEAAQLRLSPEQWRRPPRSRGVPSAAGPRIVIRDPRVVEEGEGRVISTTTPTRLNVSFEENQAPVDMGSLDVSASKGFFSKSLTPLLKPYVDGTALRVDQLEIPAGRFLITIEIADAHGEKTAETFRLEVSAR